MKVFKEPRSETFKYGFLTSRTARLLYEYSPDASLDVESRLLLDRAERFVDQILTGDAFISGDKDGLTPSIEALHVLHYGREALTVMQGMSTITKSEDHARLRSAIVTIKDTLSEVKTGQEPAPEELLCAATFFNVIADALLEEALEHSHPVTFAMT